MDETQAHVEKKTAKKSIKLILQARYQRTLLTLCVIGLCLAGLSLCAQWLWIGNLLNHLSAHLVVVLLCLLPFVARRALPAALLLMALCIFSAPWVYQAYEQRAPALAHPQESVLFMTANTAWWNKTDPQQVADAIIEANPDFCVVVEAHPDLAQILRRNKLWVHRIGTARIGPYSLLVVTRLELVSQNIHVIKGSLRELESPAADGATDTAMEGVSEPAPDLANQDMLIYEIVLRVQGRDLRVIAAHPPSPLFPRLLKDRSAVLREVVDMVQQSAEPCVVLGDFNMVPASLEWRQLHALGLYRPRGMQARTWMPQRLALLRQCGLTIDYIAASAGIEMTPLRYVQIPGSDHLGIASRIGFAPAAAP